LVIGETAYNENSLLFEKKITDLMVGFRNHLLTELSSESNVWAFKTDRGTLYTLVVPAVSLDARPIFNIINHAYPDMDDAKDLRELENILTNLFKFTFFSPSISRLGFQEILERTERETAYIDFKSVTLDTTPTLPTDLINASETDKNKVFVGRHTLYYGSFVPEDARNFYRCEKSSYILTALAEFFNERVSYEYNRHISSHVLKVLYTSCVHCGKKTLKNNVKNDLCNSCLNIVKRHDLDLEMFSKFHYSIKDYSHKQELKFLTTDKEKEGNNLFLGVELEVDTDYIDENNDEGNPCGCGEDECNECNDYYNRENNGSINHGENSNIVLHKLNGKDDNNVLAKYDGSLDSGFELVSQPATLNAHLEKINWKGAFDTLSKLHYSSHDKGTCGLHVHVNRNFFGDNKATQNYNGAKIVYLLEKYWDDFVLFTRRRGGHLERWARKGNAKNEYDNDSKKTSSVLTDAFQKNYYDHGNKYVALNTLHSATFELRIFRGTLNYKTFVATLQFTDNLVRLVKRTPLSRLTELKFEDIINYRPYNELTEYWKLRKNGRSLADNQ
jgi:hypothetical protein